MTENEACEACRFWMKSYRLYSSLLSMYSCRNASMFGVPDGVIEPNRVVVARFSVFSFDFGIRARK